MSHPDIDLDTNPSTQPHLRDVLEQSLKSPSRRSLIRGGIGLAALSAVPFLGTPGANAVAATMGGAQPALGFPSVGKSLLDQVVLPPGYRYEVLHATGDPITSQVADYSNVGAENDDWSQRIGDHHDGMDVFFLDAQGRYTTANTDRAILCVNHESSADAHFFHAKGQTSGGVSGKKFTQFGDWDLGDRPADEVLKEINHHGVSVVEIRKENGRWRYVKDSPFNRRVTAQSPMEIAGPRAQLADIQRFMATRYDPQGAKARGTINNCGHGKTPWGTYLTCEENWAFYFQMPKGSPALDERTQTARRRYGVPHAALAEDATTGRSQGWHTPSATDDRFARWNLAPVGASAAEDFRNESNTFGYIVEIDPLKPESTPLKHVALGRFAHEGAVCGIPVAGQPLAFYMGCDSRNEYIYKFVSAANWDPADVGGGLQAGRKYLDEGKLYVARFDADGRGEWIELTINDPRIANHDRFKFENQADVYVHVRIAADAVGATRMDRPEWGAVNPRNGEVYFTLTNNSASNRTPQKVDAANPRAYEDIDGKKRSGNPNGHIIRFREDQNAGTAMAFTWDIFLFGAEPDHPQANLSQLTDANALSSPDGLWFSEVTGICWIQTDDSAMTDESLCMMLAAIPGEVGDGGPITVQNRMTVQDQVVEGTQQTFMGAVLGENRLRRFLVGPPGCEITGVTESPDGKAMFVNIQHPGENTEALGEAAEFALESTWPGNRGYGPQGRPRSATIVITREDGGVIGV